MNKVIENIKKLCPLSDKTISELEAKVVKCHFPKKYKLVEAGVYNRYAYFIEEGMTRSYWLVEGEEITTSFSFEGSIVFSMDELYYGKRSEEYVETLEECEAYRISITDLIHLWNTNM